MSLSHISLTLRTCTRVIAIFVAMACVPFIASARNAADFLVNAPSQVIALLDSTTRLDMLDYFHNGLQTTSANALGGSAKLVSVEPRKVELQQTRDSGIQLCLVPNKGDTVIAVIETLLLPLPDSKLTLYSKDWKPLAKQPASLCPMDFVSKENRRKARKAAMPELLFVKIDFNPANDTFTFRQNAPAYYIGTSKPEGIELMDHSITMQLKGHKLKQYKP